EKLIKASIDKWKVETLSLSLGRSSLNLPLATATLAFEAARERQKPDDERKSGFQERDFPEMLARNRASQNRYDRRIAEAVMKHILAQLLEMPVRDQPTYLRTLIKK